ncbi:hypothetical protein AAG906_022143 [Vitis piasezkii]
MTMRPLLLETDPHHHRCLIGNIEEQVELPWYHDIHRSAYDRTIEDRIMREVHAVSPKSSSGHEYILVAIDYFTKWVEATSYANLIAVKVAKFIKSHIICRYEIPHEFISNRGHHRSSTYRPQTNGAVEAANKNIKRILRKMLHFALWAYRTSFRTSTRATPFSLVYGMKVVLPIKIEKRVKPRKFQKGDLVLRVLRGLISDPRVAISLLPIYTLIYPVVHGFYFLNLASLLLLSLSFVFIVSSCPSFVFPYVMMMCSHPSTLNQAESLGSHDSLIFDIAHSEASTSSCVCFDIFRLDGLRPLVEVWDVSRPSFLEDIEESHNTGAYPISDVVLISYIGAFDFLLIRVIYWLFLDAILGHTPSPFKLLASQVCWQLSVIVSRSPIFSAALRNHIPYHFDDSPASCLDPLSFWQFSSIVFRSPIFRRLSDIVFGSPIFLAALRHRVQNPYLFDDSPASCPDPLSFRRLSNIVSESPIFSTAL